MKLGVIFVCRLSLGESNWSYFGRSWGMGEEI